MERETAWIQPLACGNAAYEQKVSLVPSGELDDRECEEAGVGREETGSADIPCDCGRGNAESTASLANLRRAFCVLDEVVNEEKQEGDVQKSEEDHQTD